MSMQIPRDIYDTWKVVADKFKFLHQGKDDERREATKRGVQTIRARHGEGGKRWAAKSQHNTGWAAQSKDALAFIPDGPVVTGRNAQMDMFDMINGSTRETNAFPISSHNHEEGNHTAYILVPDDYDWIADGSTPVPPPSDSTHLYDGGGNDTGTCDICGKDRFDPVHNIPAASQPHTYNGGEQDTGLCDICQKAKSDPIHSNTQPVPPDSDLEARVAALEQKVEWLTQNMVSEQRVNELAEEVIKTYEVFTDVEPGGPSFLRHDHGVKSELRKK